MLYGVVVNLVQHSSRRGFTLVEIMVAVGILAMLTAIAVPAFQRAKHQAQATVFAAEMKQTIEALERYQGEQGKLPAPKLAYNTGFSNYLQKNSTWNTYSAMGGRWSGWVAPSRSWRGGMKCWASICPQ